MKKYFEKRSTKTTVHYKKSVILSDKNLQKVDEST